MHRSARAHDAFLKPIALTLDRRASTWLLAKGSDVPPPPPSLCTSHAQPLPSPPQNTAPSGWGVNFDMAQPLQPPKEISIPLNGTSLPKN